MKKIRFEFDYECYPLWDITDIKNNGLINLNPFELNIPLKIKKELDDLNNSYQSTYNRNNPQYSGFETKNSANEFINKALDISIQLQDLLDLEDIRIPNVEDLIV